MVVQMHDGAKLVFHLNDMHSQATLSGTELLNNGEWV